MDKLSYSLGISVGQNLQRTGVESIEIEDFKNGVLDTITGQETKIDLVEAAEILQEFTSKIGKKRADAKQKEKEDNQKLEEDYLKENGERPGVITTESGLQYEVLRKGTGATPKPHSRVKCHYEGHFISGEIFDSSYVRKQPAVFGLDQVIPGWTEGLQYMQVGAKYEFWIPWKLGYGETGIPGTVPPCSTLIFTVELLETL